MIYEGKILHILPLETISTGGGDRQKQTIVLEENRDSEYKGGIVFDLWGDKVSLISAYQVGDIVSVSLNSKAREYNGRWYNSLTAWKIEGSEGGEGVATPPNSSTSTPEAKSTEHEDDLPF